MIICIPSLPKKDLPFVVVNSDDVIKRLSDYLIGRGITTTLPAIHRFDPNYGLYTSDQVLKVKNWAVNNMYIARRNGPVVV